MQLCSYRAYIKNLDKGRAREMAEGKTLDMPSIKCESCEEADSAKFCIECNQPMCTKCIRIHGRVASTKTHNFIPLEDYKLLASSLKGTATSAYCAKHHQKIINKICEECLVVLCSECESDHKGHKLNSGSFDANFLHRLSVQKVPGLLEILQELKDLEDGSPEKIRLFKEAERLVKSWKDQLLDVITKDADRLLGDIRGEIKKHEQMLASTSAKIKECIVKTDHQITKMSESRKISDTTKLLDQMSKCDKEVDDIKSYIEEVKLSHGKPAMKDILPYQDEFKQAVKILKKLFTKANQDKLTCASSKKTVGDDKRNTNPQKQKMYTTLRLANETLVRGKIDGLKLCDSYQKAPNELIVFEHFEKKIQIFDTSLTKTKTFISSKRIHRMVKVNRNRFVIIEWDTQNIHLMNENFEFLETIAKPDSGFIPWGLCTNGVNKCTLSEVNRAKGKTRVKHINLVGGTVSSKIECENNVLHWNSFNYLVNNDNGLVTLSDSYTTLSTINLETGNITKVHNSEGKNLSICRDDENVLVGTDNGYIYKVTPRQQSSVLLKGLGRVGGLQVADSGIVVISDDKLQIYQQQ